jgi:SAM-dependent methyltransferase
LKKRSSIAVWLQQFEYPTLSRPILLGYELIIYLRFSIPDSNTVSLSEWCQQRRKAKLTCVGSMSESFLCETGGQPEMNDRRKTADQRQLHNEMIVKQFGMQAVPFAQMPGHTESMDLIFDLCGTRPDDEALDVACGPGLVACSLAERVRHVTGIDLTPEMIEQARKLQHEKGLTNLEWKIGDVLPLPFPQERFSLVVTRYSFQIQS